MPAKLLEGPVLLHVGERPQGDPKYASDEYVYAPPGTIVAPRLRSEPPTKANAARAIIRQGRKLGMFDKSVTADDLLGGNMPNLPGLAAYHKLRETAGQRGVRRSVNMQPHPQPTAKGPPRFRAMHGAQTGAAVNPTGDALSAINMVAQKYGVDIPTAVSMLTGVPQTPVNQGVQSTIPYAEGGESMAGLLNLLLGAAGITGPDLMTAQLAIMNSLGTIDPRAIGVTDPAQFRTLLAEGQGMPTLDLRKQKFNESLFGFSQSSPQRGNVPAVASS